MKNSVLTLSIACAIAATASAQVKLQTTPKVPQHGYIAPPTGTQLLAVGGSDDCSTAFAADSISGPGTFAMTNVGATNGAPDAAVPCVNTQLDVWFYWTSTQTGTARVQFCGQTGTDTVITVWPDDAATACPTGATSVACNDDSCGLQSFVQFPATIGQTFFFQIGAFGALTTYASNFIVDYAPPPTGNDDCSLPVALVGNGPHPYDIAPATTGVEGQAEAICLFFGTMAIRKDLWFTWTPTMTGSTSLTLCGQYTGVNSTTDSKVSIYDGAGCPTAASIGCNDDDNSCTATPLTTTVTWSTVCGQTYTIQLGTFSAVTTATMAGTFTITESGSPCSPPATPFCFGDGTLTDHTTPCPCANNGAAGNGCANSANVAGANLTTSGTTATDDVSLLGSGMPLTVSCIYLQGDGTEDMTFGDGTRCAGGTLIRLRTKANSGGASSFPDSNDTITLSVRGGVVVGSGAVRYYQTYYRNSAPAFCPPETFNVTNGIILTW